MSDPASQPGVQSLWTPRQVACRLGVSRATFYRHAAAGECPPMVVLPSGRKRWKPADVERWIERHKR